MRIKELVDLFEHGRRQYLLLGDSSAGVLVGLTLEGRLFGTLHQTEACAQECRRRYI